MLTDEIYEAALALGAEATSGGLETLCRAAESELTARLRSGITPEDCKASFVTAAALMVLSVMDGAQSGEVSSVKIGDITVHRTESSSLRSQAEVLMAPYICDGGFCFRGVRG